jgi:hypothetical protein
MSSFRYECPHCTKRNVIQAGNVGSVVVCLHCKQNVDWDGENPICAPATSLLTASKVNWRGLRMGIGFLIVGLPMFAYGGWQTFQARRSAFWPSAAGVVLSSAIGHPTGTSKKTSAAEIRYSYKVSGVSYENDPYALVRSTGTAVLERQQRQFDVILSGPLRSTTILTTRARLSWSRDSMGMFSSCPASG